MLNAALALLIILCAYFALKTINEVKANKYIGAGVTPGSTIVVTGTGEVQAVPDIATETITIQSDGKTQKEAQDKTSVKEKKVLDFLSSSDIEDKDIKTLSNNVYPKYDYGATMPCTEFRCPPAPQVIVGYTATEVIQVKIRNTEDTGKIVQGLTATGVELSGRSPC